MDNRVDNKRNGMAKPLSWLLLVILLAAAIFGTYSWQKSKINDLNGQVDQLKSTLSSKDATSAASYTSGKEVKVKVYTPQKNQVVASPLIILGEVPGSWSFEASFPVKVVDSDGKKIATARAELLSDWMTDELVPFSVKLKFDAKTVNGALVLQKDNPSGLPENDDSVSISIKF